MTLLNEGCKPFRQHHRHLNPNIQKVVMKEVIKLLEARIIYIIWDIEWESPVQIVPKKDVWLSLKINMTNTYLLRLSPGGAYVLTMANWVNPSWVIISPSFLLVKC